MRLGIRAQLLVSMGALLLVALLPLVVVVERLTHAHLRQQWELDARALGRSIASHVAEVRATRSSADLDALLAAEIGSVAGLAVYGRDGVRERAAGPSAHLPERVATSREETRRLTVGDAPALLVIVPGASGSVAALLVAEDARVRAAAVVRLVALYTGLLGAMLLLLSYVVLTRFVIGPVERLSRAAVRVAEGARELPPVREGARELVELGSSLSTMTGALRSEEAELRRTIEEVRSAKAELEAAQATLVESERLASVGRLAAGLAHEIGNPLAAISSLEELLADSPTLDDEERELLARMRHETERMQRVLRDLLDFARPSRIVARDELEPAGDVGVAAAHVAQLVRPQRAFRELELRLAIAEGLPAVTLSPSRLEQIFLNLVLNAADASPPGGVIDLRANVHAGVVRVEVEDQGGGVDPSIADTLFEPFVTTKDVGKGTGLGLSVCRGLVEGAAGAIRHEPGAKGARFVVELPPASAPA
ncbi:MAG: HAMP domain-containing histidine kinase [Deltaproteobacteria bacterium]|nr:HAMP domain-containing histidine kinase [Deltaproteobacteria bacterium]